VIYVSTIKGTLKRVNSNQTYDDLLPATDISLVNGYAADVALRISGNTVTGTAASFTSNNPTLAAGQYGIESDTGYLKIGNGVTAWNNLIYVNMPTGNVMSLEVDDGTGTYNPVLEGQLVMEVWDDTEGEYVEVD
jgi:hypothetical protein